MGGLEDPERILEQAVTDMQGDLVRLRQAAAEVTAAQRRLENRRATAQGTADEWRRRAELALGKGDEALAREALTRRKAYAATAAQLEGQLEQQGKAVATITANMRMLEGRLQEARLKKDTLKARAQSARSARQIQDMVAGLSTGSALGAFDKMEEKVLAMEAEAEAATMVRSVCACVGRGGCKGGCGMNCFGGMSLGGSVGSLRLPRARCSKTPLGVGPAQLAAPADDVEAKFRELESGNVEDDLAELRRNLGTRAPSRQVGS